MTLSVSEFRESLEPMGTLETFDVDATRAAVPDCPEAATQSTREATIAVLHRQNRI
jgi:hypothetical protein